jgi:hypothetical protein
MRRCCCLAVLFILVACGHGESRDDSSATEAPVESGLGAIPTSPVPDSSATLSAASVALDSVPGLIGTFYVPYTDSVGYGGREFESGRYALWLRQSGGRMMALLTRITDRDYVEAPYAPWAVRASWEVMDARYLPTFGTDQELVFAGMCKVAGEHRRDIVALIPTRRNPEALVPTGAWMADTTKMVIRPIEAGDILCTPIREGG